MYRYGQVLERFNRLILFLPLFIVLLFLRKPGQIQSSTAVQALPDPASVCGGGFLNQVYMPLIQASGTSPVVPDFKIETWTRCLENRTGVDGETASSDSPSTRVLQVSVTGQNGFTGLVTLSLGSLPQGVLGTFDTTSLAPGENAFLSLTIPASLTPGIYPITIQGQNAGKTHQAFLWLIQREKGPGRWDEDGPRPDQKASLVAQTITPSLPYPIVGEGLNLLVDIKNAGATILRSVPLEIYAGDHLYAVRYIDLPPRESARVVIPWTPGSAGPFSFTAVVDPDQALTEIYRLDNQVSAEILVSEKPPAGADYAIDSAGLITPPVKPSYLQAVVTNHGTVAGTVPLVFRVNGQVAATRLVGPLDPGQTTTIIEFFPAEPLRQFSAEVNPRFKNLEAVILDNLFTATLAQDVDLAVQELSVYSIQREDGQPQLLTVSFLVKNNGPDDVSQSFRTRIDPGEFQWDPDGGRFVPFIVTTQGLKAGQAVYISRTIPAPASYKLDIGIQADFDLAVGESNEVNNLADTYFSDPRFSEHRWYNIGPRKLTGIGASGRLHAIVIDPIAPDTIYVGAPSGGGPGGSGVWKTTDGGSTWQSISDSLPALQIYSLAMDPADHNRLYLLTNTADLYTTADAGTSWTLVSNNANLNSNILLVSPVNSNVMYANSSQGVIKSMDRGLTWNTILMGGSAQDVVIDSSNSNRLLAALFHPTDFSVVGIYQSDDAGANWRMLTGCPGGSLPAATAKTRITLGQSGSKWYAGYRTTSDTEIRFTVYYTTDTGCSIGGRLESSWKKGWTVGGAPGTAGGNEAATFWDRLNADPQNKNYVFAGGTAFYTSSDGGDHFSKSSGPHADQHGFAVDPNTSQTIYTVNDGGIYRSNNHGASGSWTFIGGGIANVEFYDGALTQADNTLVIGGTQDNGTEKYTGSTIWTEILGGDGATVDIDRANKDILYGMNQYATSIQRFMPSTGWKNISNGLPTGAECFNLPFMVHPGNPDLILASCHGVLWSSPTTPPGNWSTIFTPPTGGGAVSFSMVDKTVNLYYAASNNGRIYAGLAGAGWVNVFTHPSNRGVTDLETDPNAPTTLYASFSGSQGAGRVYQLKRSSPTPTSLVAKDITFDLPPDLTIISVTADRMNENTIYAAARARGVYRGKSYDNGNTWTWSRYSDGLPFAVDVRDLNTHPVTGVLLATTMGRSMFQLNTAAPIGSLLAAQGRLTFLRVNDVGAGFGPPTDFLNAEVIFYLDTLPGKYFGFQLRTDASEDERRGMLDLLRDAYLSGNPVRIDYIRTGIHSGMVIRLVEIP